MFFSGNLFSGSVTINGRKVNFNDNNRETTKYFDKNITEESKNIRKISVYSDIVHTNVVLSSDSHITVHFYGNADIEENKVKFNVFRYNNGELSIELKFEENCCYYNSYLTLDITVPKKMFEAIVIETQSAGITCEDIISKRIQLKSIAGPISVDGNFDDVFVKTVSGRVEINAELDRNLHLYVSTVSGSVETKIHNTNIVEIVANSVSGIVQNNHRNIGHYNIIGSIDTMSGSININ